MTATTDRRHARAVIGDVGDFRDVLWEGTEDLDGVSACEAHVWTRTVRERLDAEVIDADTKVIRIYLGAEDDGWLATAPVADWSVEVQCTWPGPGPDGTVLTSPVGRPLTLSTRQQGYPA